MFKNIRDYHTFFIVTLFGIGFLLNLPSALSAEQMGNLQAISVSGQYPVLMGNDDDRFVSNGGVQAEGWISAPSFFDPNVDIHFVGEWQPFDVKNLDNANITQWNFMGGLELHTHQVMKYIQPFISLDLGVSYNVLTFPDQDNVPQNAGIDFTAQFRTGMQIPVFANFNVLMELPVHFILADDHFWSLSPSLGVRYSL